MVISRSAFSFCNSLNKFRTINMKRIIQNKKAFTLIELMVIIVILGLLASIILVATNEVRFKARDARRASELNEVAKALEAYYTEKGHYPDYNDKVDLEQNWADMINELKTSGIISRITAKSLMAFTGPVGASIQDPLFPDRTYYYVPSLNNQSYRIRAKFEKIDNSLLDTSLQGEFLYEGQTTGDDACDVSLGYYCKGIGNSTDFDPGD